MLATVFLSPLLGLDFTLWIWTKHLMELYWMKETDAILLPLTMICVGQNDGIKAGVMFFVNIAANPAIFTPHLYIYPENKIYMQLKLFYHV